MRVLRHLHFEIDPRLARLLVDDLHRRNVAQPLGNRAGELVQNPQARIGMHDDSEFVRHLFESSRTSYTQGMARGWESKSVESQMDSAAEDAALAHRIRKTPEQVERESKLHALMLSRTRVLNDLKS